MVEYGLERRKATSFTYVQGAGDDHEMWSHVSRPNLMLFIKVSFLKGLTPSMFWEHRNLLLSCDRENLLKTIEQLTHNGVSGQSIATSYPTLIAAAQNAIALGMLASQVPKACAKIYIRPHEEDDEHNLSSDSERALRLRIRHGKKGEREFVQEVLPAVDTFCAKQLMMQQSELRLAVLCSTASVDVAIGVTVMVLARYFGTEGERLDNGGTTSKPDAPTPRPFMLTVNSILERVGPSSFRMDPEKHT